MLVSDYGRFGADPFMELRRIQNEFNRLLTDVAPTTVQQFPLINVWVGENSAVVTAEVPGVSHDDMNVTVQEDTIVLDGKRAPKLEGQEVIWHRRERSHDPFSRTVHLPFRVNPDQVHARFREGVLEIEVQRPEEDRPKKIKINAAA
jgi:HSP20 family protein